jgi:molybdopterin/thiamine biosynthesis adenylyltransferase
MASTNPDRFARLRERATLRDGGFDRLRDARIVVFGGGALGGLLAPAIVRSGAAVAVVDFDIGSTENGGTQLAVAGVSKVDTVVAACNAIEPGRACGFACDVRHVGIGVLDEFDLFIDCTDDANLALPLTEINNGLGKPLLRCAVDGSGATEMGRVLCSSAESGHACQLCPLCLEDIVPKSARTGCLEPQTPSRPPTIAGGAVPMAIVGLALLSAERLISGNDDDLVYDREVLLDFTNLKLLPMQLKRSSRCISGHVRWELCRIDKTASSVTLEDVFTLASEELAADEVSLEPYLHPLNELAECECGQVMAAVGTAWAAAPQCPSCGNAMAWRRTILHTRITRQLAHELGILSTPLSGLGLPADGAMIVARSSDSPPIRYVLQG